MMQTELPKIAIEFIKKHHSGKKRKSVLRAFHHWMTHWKIGFKELRRAHIESFIRCPKDKNLSSSRQDYYRKYLTRYLLWLYDKELLGFDPRCFDKRLAPPLSPTAADFIRFLSPTHKINTTNGYQVSLRNFHRWLDEHEISLDTLQRQEVSSWREALSVSGKAPKTIRQHLVYVRCYLQWLYENGTVSSYPNDLIRPSDMVKLPQYLPRPLPPAADKVLQERLATSDDIYCQGLLLMRKTGLRIGELISLENNCIRSDHMGNHFLKVPLGKLNTERLVPLDDSAVAAIDNLQSSNRTAAGKTFLIETMTGGKTSYLKYSNTLKQACQGLETNGKMVTHRLRHTYATTLLSAGMSLVCLMKLLGHKDIQMTLRYAQITQETVGKEYFQALTNLQHRYATICNTDNHAAQEKSPVKILNDAVHLIRTLAADDDSIKTIARLIIKRIQRIQADVQTLFCTSS